MTTPVDSKGLRGSLVVPNWLSNRSGKNVGFSLLWVIALASDFLVQTALEGFRAALPGIGTSTALSLIGASRGLIQGRVETDAAFALRLQAWLTTWENAGQDQELANEVRTYLGGSTVVRVVNRRGHFVTANADGTFSIFNDVDWGGDWDGTSNPGNSTHWSDIWLIVYPDPTYDTYTSIHDASWDFGNTGGTALGLGHKVPRAQRDAILQIVSAWKGAHTYVQAIIWSDNPALFVPGSLPTAGNPNGTWGGWSYPTVPGRQTGVRTTTTAGGKVRYWGVEVVP